MNKIIEKLMALLPTVEAGATEVIELATEVKAAAQATGEWTQEHDDMLQKATAIVTPPVVNN